MGRNPGSSKEEMNRGAWTAIEDKLLTDYIQIHGAGKWKNISKKTGLKRCGKSCRLRWLNYLRPGIKRGNITLEEEDLIIRLHKLLGNRWSLIAGRLPGRTDNEIKNYWNTIMVKKMKGDRRTNEKKKKKKKEKMENSSLNSSPLTPIDPTPSVTNNETECGNIEEYNMQNFSMDFNVEEFLVSDFDFWKFCEFSPPNLSENLNYLKS